MASNEPQSKRERQKQRRDVKLEQQRIADAKARRNRLLTFALLGVIFAGLVGGAVYNNRQKAAEAEKKKQETLAILDDLGCTEEEKVADAGQGHLEGAALAQSPPETLYPERPATSGEHYGSWMITGVYDQVIDERALVHNLEHGYIVAYYDEGADEEQVTALKEFAQSQIDDARPKTIVAAWDGDLPGEANFAYTAWNYRQMCAEYNEDVFDLFSAAHYSGAGEAPEKGLPPHTDPDSGIDPGTDPYLLPPLGDQQPTPGMSEGAGNTADPSETSS